MPQPTSPFQFFQQGGPLGYWPNNYAANAGDLPNILWATSLQTPILNSFTPVMPPLVTDIFGGGAQPLGSPTRPFPIGANPGGTSLTQVGGTVGSTMTSSGAVGGFGNLQGTSLQNPNLGGFSALM